MKELIKKLIPSFLLNWYHFLLAFSAAFLYWFPSRKLKVIGITGTNGKSTTVELTAKVLEQAGYGTAFLSSIKFKIKEKEWQNMFKMTMPGRFEVQKFLRKALNAGCEYAVLEITSEGIKQHRHCFINFEAAVLTNLTPEHIESHGGFENYRVAKGKLFKATKKFHIINIDDKNAEYFLQFSAKKKYLYGMNKGEINNKEINLNLQLIGDFNIYNALAAICVGISQGVDLKVCKKAVEKVKGIKGRMDEVISHPFKVIVDYAVTPDALERLYQTIEKTFSPKRIISVFGSCGGGRDKWRRPVLGEIAAKYCDEIIITNEDPYNEDPSEILSMIKSGIFKSQKTKRTLSSFPPLLLQTEARFPISNFHEILDRRQAIRKSLELSRPGDIVLITGKGCEPWMCLANNKKIPWDDRKIVEQEFELLSNQALE